MISKCIVFVVLLRLTHGYAIGAPSTVCETMLPNNITSNRTTPFTITLSAPTFKCNDEITVTLGGSNQFKGFLCQARPVLDIYATSGSLAASGNVTMRNNCGTIAAITHTENSLKRTAVFKWTPPITGMTDVYIVCTIVQDRPTHHLWDKLNSSVLKYDSACSGTGHMTLSPTTVVLLVCIIFSLHTI